jgi:hypothetical protein
MTNHEQDNFVQEEEVNTVTFMSDYRRGFGLGIGFIDHFNTQHVTTLNYIAIANLHTLQIITAH